MKKLSAFKNVIELNEYFRDENRCREYLEKILWDGKPFCPHCGNEEHYAFADGRRYKCKICKKQYTVTVGTFLESSKIPLRKWLHAIFIFCTHTKGVSSHQLAKDLGITQKSGWFVLSRIREILREKAPQMLTGVVEIDETYVGGKVKNKHKSIRANTKNKMSPMIKTPVLGLLQRDGQVLNQVIENADRATVLPIVKIAVSPDATMLTDSSWMYTPLAETHKHHSVNHTGNEYVRDGFIHTQGIEGYWSLLKRNIYGIYHQVSPKHLHRYCNEVSFRYNHREKTSVEKFDYALKQAFGRLKYYELINKVAPKKIS